MDSSIIQLQRLTPDQLQRLIGFSDPISLLEQLETCDWNNKEEIQQLVELARQEDNLNVKLRAIKYLRELLYQALEGLGLRVHAKRTLAGTDGSTISLSADLIAKALSDKPIKILPENIESEVAPPQGEPNDSRNRSKNESTSETTSETTKEGGGCVDKDQSTGDHRPPGESYSNLFPGLASGGD